MNPDPLAIRLPNSPEEAEKKYLDEKEYEEKGKEATPEKTDEIKNQAKESMGYGNFVEPENKENILKDEYYEEGDPQIEVGKTKNDDFPKNKTNLLIIDFLKGKNIDISNVALNFNKDGIIDTKGIDGLDKDESNELKNLIEKTEKTDNKTKILNFSKVVNNITQLKDYNTSLNGDGRFEEPILNIIGEEYMDVPNKKPEENISLAIEIKRYSIEKEVKNLKIDTQTYKTSIANIESGDLNKQIEGIRSLHALAYSGEGKYSKKRLDKYKEKRRKELNDERKKLIQKYPKGDISKDEMIKKIEKIREDFEKLKTENSELDDGEVFEATEIDKNSESIEEKPKN